MQEEEESLCRQEKKTTKVAPFYFSCASFSNSKGLYSKVTPFPFIYALPSR